MTMIDTAAHRAGGDCSKGNANSMSISWMTGQLRQSKTYTFLLFLLGIFTYVYIWMYKYLESTYAYSYL